MHNDFFRIKSNNQLPSYLPDPPAGLRWSKALWGIQKDGWTAVYRPLNLALIYFRDNRKKYPPGKDLTDRLIEEKFWIPENSNQDEQDHRKLIEKARSGVFRFICILPTSDCDYTCAYCHQRHVDNGYDYMTISEIENGMRKCAELCIDYDKPLDILIYGGEPLKAFHLTEKIIELSDSVNGIFHQEVRISFTTSGDGLQFNQAKILAENDVFVILSLDAPPEINDRVRYCQHGGSSYKTAEIAFKMLKEVGCRVGLSVTIGKHNYENFADNLDGILNDFQPDDIGLNAYLHPINSKANPFQISAKKALRAFIEGIEITSKKGIYTEQPFRRFKPFIYRSPLLKDCSSPGERLVLVPGGKIGFCDSCYPSDEYFYSLDDFPTGSTDADYRVWSSLSSPEMPECRECPAMTVCGGACRYDAYRETGKLNGVSKSRCNFEKMLLDWMIWELKELADPGNVHYLIPSIEDREMLMSNVTPQIRNQPFTAGSYFDK